MLLPGVASVPVTPVGVGLSPGDTSSVAPSGMPVGETDVLVPRPNGDVVPIVGVGVAVPPTCAMATLERNAAGRIVAINEILIIGIFLLKRARRPKAIGRRQGDRATSITAPGSSPGVSIVILIGGAPVNVSIGKCAVARVRSIKLAFIRFVREGRITAEPSFHARNRMPREAAEAQGRPRWPSHGGLS